MKQAVVSLLLLALAACGMDVIRPPTDGGPDGDSLVGLDGGDDTNEPCNGIDDDGDGRVDTDAAGNALARTCQTDCGTGNEYCEGGEWVCYAPQPRQEVCDNFDNNCDGEIDEGCSCRVGDTQNCGQETLGACHGGVQTCQPSGTWSDCTGEGLPTDETCGNGIDDDCDGETDETCGCAPGSEQPCGTDEGQCTAGTQTCSAGGEWGDCTNQEGSSDEVCNGLDDNCDGATDEFWSMDAYEGNDTCDRRFDAGDLDEGGEAIVLNDLSLFASGEEDWFSLTALEGSDLCFPGLSQCSFELTVQVTLATDIEPDDVEVCIVDGACPDAADPSHVVCTHGTNWDPTWSSYTLSRPWGGTCGYDDSKDLQVVVRSAAGATACGAYGINFRFSQVDRECP